jgi:uncharacterized protein YjbI with pentapeptide repeats
MTTPRIIDDALYQLLRQGDIDGFNQARSRGDPCDLRGTDLRGVDLRRADVRDLDLSDCYLRLADLRGLDLTRTCLAGASIRGANISGTLFPAGLAAAEIELSLTQGTRMRYR